MFTRNEIGAAVARPTSKRHPWWDLEEFKPDGGMWSIPKVLARGRHITESAELMADPGRFANSMRLVLKRWPNSVDTAFNTPGLNLRAWLGHAGCWLAVGSPEETTRLGWHELDDAEQFAANAAADMVIVEHRRALALSEDPGQSMLWEGDYA
jgi:hypothetical protein